MNNKVMSKYRMVIVGEVFFVIIDEVIKYVGLDGKELDMVFQFEYMGLDGNENLVLGYWFDCKVLLKDFRSNFIKW